MIRAGAIDKCIISNSVIKTNFVLKMTIVQPSCQNFGDGILCSREFVTLFKRTVSLANKNPKSTLRIVRD